MGIIEYLIIAIVLVVILLAILKATKKDAELDFNKLRTLKESCDILHKETLKEQEEAAEKSKNKKALIQSIKRRSDISSLKSIIKYNYA